MDQVNETNRNKQIYSLRRSCEILIITSIGMVAILILSCLKSFIPHFAMVAPLVTAFSISVIMVCIGVYRIKN